MFLFPTQHFFKFKFVMKMNTLVPNAVSPARSSRGNQRYTVVAAACALPNERRGAQQASHSRRSRSSWPGQTESRPDSIIVGQDQNGENAATITAHSNPWHQ